ncbi:methyltransferase family protein [Pseudoxanthomonas sacheonensis]|uniref:Protein-S-isoprenylcysteine O-methyltransferase Ste14 n=1 Tax=Pseudoxanthomonas sacheonensis TaxID=443615 RepID=A0ABU1RLY0_9GAMM|nr:isoprenylcysteine carboxylmethyltransferase family protein [Pseudoxanthomonas sacheonensis]MDR6839770.1 protein-S-isoprenylcysteine O-methyltransferase Ste14 [Pseudoxanthomonas sacheonensis]
MASMLTPIFMRAVIAFLAPPGVVAFLVPAAWIRLSRQTLSWPFGLLMAALGISGLLWCVRDFYVSGKGTLAPWAPRQELVVVGLYRYSRNPMYVSVVLILLGWAISFRSAGLLVYALAVALAFHLRVILGEEPWLARVHGSAWQQYSRRVRRWF